MAARAEESYDEPFRFNGLIRDHMVRVFSIGAKEKEMLAGKASSPTCRIRQST